MQTYLNKEDLQFLAEIFFLGVTYIEYRESGWDLQKDTIEYDLQSENYSQKNIHQRIKNFSRNLFFKFGKNYRLQISEFVDNKLKNLRKIKPLQNNVVPV